LKKKKKEEKKGERERERKREYIYIHRRAKDLTVKSTIISVNIGNHYGNIWFWAHYIAK